MCHPFSWSKEFIFIGIYKPYLLHIFEAEISMFVCAKSSFPHAVKCETEFTFRLEYIMKPFFVFSFEKKNLESNFQLIIFLYS